MLDHDTIRYLCPLAILALYSTDKISLYVRTCISQSITEVRDPLTWPSENPNARTAPNHHPKYSGIRVAAQLGINRDILMYRARRTHALETKRRTDADYIAADSDTTS